MIYQLVRHSTIRQLQKNNEMSIRELFNGILDTDISILIGIFFLIFFYLVWGSFIYEVFKNIDGIIENWLDKKVNKIESNSLFLSILMFFPILFIRLTPLFFLVIIGFISLILPALLLDWYLD